MTLNYTHVNDTIDKSAILFIWQYDQDSTIIDKDLFISDKDSTLIIDINLSTAYMTLAMRGFNLIDDISIDMKNGTDLRVDIVADYFLYHSINSTTKKFYMINEFESTWNESLLILPNRDTIIMKPVIE